MTVRLVPNSATLAGLAAVAQGREPADVVLTGGSLVDVFTEEILDGWGLALSGGRIAYAGPETAARVGPATEVIDLDGCLVAPGLIEGHTHLQRVGMAETIRRQVALGVTTTVLESMEFAFACGPEGLREFLAEAQSMPSRVLVTVPPLLGLDPGFDQGVAPTEEWIAFLDHPLVVGLGELYWADLLRRHPRAEALIEAALERGLVVTGHGAGARLGAINAMAAAGIGDDHEGINAADLLARLRVGLVALGRHGATRQDLRAIAPVWHDGGASLHRMTLVTDGVEPEPLAAGQSLNWVVDQAVAAGLPLARAVRMASHTVAENLGLGRWLGGTAPGMVADLVILESDRGFRADRVLAGGRPPADPLPHTYPASMLQTVRLPGFDPALLAHPGQGRWRAMELVAPLVTREVETDGADAVAVLCVDRLGGSRSFRGLLLGLGLSGGAVALSTGWECPGVLGVGDVADDLSIAITRVQELQGGAVIVSQGRILAEWRAELGGVQSLAPLGQVVVELTAVNGALRALGCKQPNPLMTVETLSTSAIPHLRIWPGGYLRLRDGARPGLSWDD